MTFDSDCMQIDEFIITGSSGFLGADLLRTIRTRFPQARTWSLLSGRHGGVDLTQPNAADQLTSQIRLRDPARSVLIHAAAVVEWNSRAALLDNAAMALNVADWAQHIGVGFSVLVSSVAVYPQVPLCNDQTACQPSNLYSAGKMAAENIWRALLKPERCGIARLAGVYGWQPRPTLFWNRLLLAAADISSGAKPVVRRARSRRNYVTVHEANACLLQIGAGRLAGVHVVAGKETVNTAEFVAALEVLRGETLPICWQDDGGDDEQIFTPSASLLPCLEDFRANLSALWSQRPADRHLIAQ